MSAGLLALCLLRICDVDCLVAWFIVGSFVLVGFVLVGIAGLAVCVVCFALSYLLWIDLML